MLFLDADLTASCVKCLKDLGMSDLATKVSVVWNNRMRTTAGRAFWPESKIEMNPKLRAIGEAQVEQTLLHELAHIVAYARCGRRRIAPHGVEWRQACADLGIAGESVTHNLPLPGRRQAKRWRYSCSSCGEGFDRVRKMKQLAACYHCCKIYNKGRYHKRFILTESKIEA